MLDNAAFKDVLSLAATAARDDDDDGKSKVNRWS